MCFCLNHKLTFLLLVSRLGSLFQALSLNPVFSFCIWGSKTWSLFWAWNSQRNAPIHGGGNLELLRGFLLALGAQKSAVSDARCGTKSPGKVCVTCVTCREGGKDNTQEQQAEDKPKHLQPPVCPWI